MANPTKLPGFMFGSAQKVFFAGLGALSIAEEKGARFFDDLVERGRNFEFKGKVPPEEVGESVSKAREAAENFRETLESTLDERLRKTFGKLGIPSKEEIDHLGDRVDTLMKSVDLLLSRQDAQGGAGRGPADDPAGE